METTRVFIVFQIIVILVFGIISFVIQRRYKLDTEKLEQYVKIINEIIFVVIIFMIVFGVLALAYTYDGLDGFLDEFFSMNYYTTALETYNLAKGDFESIVLGIMAMFIIIGLNKRNVSREKRKESIEWFYDENEHINQDNKKDKS